MVTRRPEEFSFRSAVSTWSTGLNSDSPFHLIEDGVFFASFDKFYLTKQKNFHYNSNEIANDCGDFPMENERKVTINDIARILGVSSSTVSRAISGKPGVNRDLRNKILSMARELGYIPNIAAKSLKTSKTKTIGLLVSDIKNPFFQDFMSGLENVLFHRGYKFIVCNTDEDIKKEEIYLKWLLEHGVDGIVAAPLMDINGNNNRTLYRKARKFGIKVVFYDRLLESNDDFDSITIDNRQAIFEAVEYLKKLGHRELGIYLYKSNIYTVKERLEGFKRACEIFDLPFNQNWVIDGATFSKEEDYKKAIVDVLSSKHRPSAILATNYFITRMILKAAKDLDLKVPDELSIVGFDDIVENELVTPTITTIKQPVIEMGKIAGTLILDLIDNKSGRISKIVLKTELVIRESVRKIA
ncbi:MAG: LacI family transcriptional regulator [Thermotogaceae bacterium]|jgi:LacI family transcriptional regulator|nr:LacI family transcriptional regulator [Thermotogaceae bacterium]